MTHLQLLRRICQRFGLEEDDVRGPSRLAGPLRARKVAVYVLRADRGLSFGEIARLLRTKKPNVHRMYYRAAQKPDAACAEFVGLKERG